MCAKRSNPTIVWLGSAAGIVEGSEAQGANQASRPQYDSDCIGKNDDVHADAPQAHSNVHADAPQHSIDHRVERRRLQALQIAGAVSFFWGLQTPLMTKGGPAVRSGLPRALV